MSEPTPEHNPVRPDVTLTAAADVAPDLVERFARALIVELGAGALVRLLTDGADEGTNFTIDEQPRPRCRWCTKPLRQEYTNLDSNGRWNPDVRRPMWEHPGYRGCGRFCTKQCAAAWAVFLLGGDIHF